jgi:hypothetical protein
MQDIAKTHNGIIKTGISNAEYHADRSSFSSSILKMMNCPAKAKWEIENPSPRTETLALGSAIHKWILERDQFNEEFLIGIDRARRSKDDRQAWADWYSERGADGNVVIDRPAAEWNAEFERQTGKNMVTPDTLKMLIDMADAVASNPNANELISKGVAEQSVYWTDDETGLNLRCRPDYMNAEFISDLKSAAEIDDRAIIRAVANFSYSLSQGMYQQGVYEATGQWRPFLFIFVEKSPPYQCRVISLDEAAAIAGYEKYREAARILKTCIDTGEWPGYKDNLNFQLPEWAL